MPRKSPSFSRADVKAMWKLLEGLGEEPCAIKYHGDGSFRIMTKKYLSQNPNAPLVASDWDEVFQ